MRSLPHLPCLLALLPLATLSGIASADGEYTNFRVGTSLTRLTINPGADYLPDSSDRGVSLFAEYPQSNHAASRFTVYRVHNDGKDLTGFETQLMWGWGLAKEGFRLYSGPAWHREKILVDRGGNSKTRFFNGWGWQIGSGYQLGAVTFDIAATWRDDQDYRAENQRAENQAAGVSHERPNVWFRNIMISYRF